MGLFKWLRNGAHDFSGDIDNDPAMDAYEEDDTDEDEDEALGMRFVCEECGQEFLLDDAVSFFNAEFPDLSYEYEVGCGKVCGFCAVDKVRAEIDKDDVYDEEDEEDDGDVGCRACGNPAYPDCKTACSLFDD